MSIVQNKDEKKNKLLRKLNSLGRTYGENNVFMIGKKMFDSFFINKDIESILRKLRENTSNLLKFQQIKNS
jgi:hypothetical protein